MMPLDSLHDGGDQVGRGLVSISASDFVLEDRSSRVLLSLTHGAEA
jgi:hypothetical protein